MLPRSGNQTEYRLGRPVLPLLVRRLDAQLVALQPTKLQKPLEPARRGLDWETRPFCCWGGDLSRGEASLGSLLPHPLEEPRVGVIVRRNVKRHEKPALGEVSATAEGLTAYGEGSGENLRGREGKDKKGKRQGRQGRPDKRGEREGEIMARTMRPAPAEKNGLEGAKKMHQLIVTAWCGYASFHLPDDEAARSQADRTGRRTHALGIEQTLDERRLL